MKKTAKKQKPEANENDEKLEENDEKESAEESIPMPIQVIEPTLSNLGLGHCSKTLAYLNIEQQNTIKTFFAMTSSKE